MIALGLSNRQIGKRLFLSDRTVEWHIQQILNRLGFSSRSEIAAWVGRTQTAARVRVPGAMRHGNLPAPLTSFVGRDDDSDGLKGLLAKNRLVTVVGPGGSGKTRLAIKIADELEPSFPDRAWLCDLAPVADGGLVADSIAQALGLASETRDRLAAVRTHLVARTALLLLDNCDHLLPAAADIAGDLLAACRGLRILATSLAPLGVLGEAVWRLQPLSQSDAVQLFVVRANASAPNLTLDATEEGRVDEICSQLDRLPLAIELAAPRLRVLTLAELADAVLETAPSRSQDRHGSLDDLATWGYQTLLENERELFGRLSIFAGWFEHEDAAAIAPRGAPVRQLLASLVEKSMVAMERTARGEARYRLLETLKVFGRSRLKESGQFADARIAHAERMIWLAERPALYSPDPRSSIRIGALVDDMRAAMASLLELRPRRATRFAAALAGFWRVSGRYFEGVRWDNTVLANDPEPSFDRCWLLYGHTILLLDLGNREEAMSTFIAANAMAGLPECEPMRGHLLIWRGWVEQLLGNIAAGEALYRQAVVQFDRAGGNPYSSRALAALVVTLMYEGSHEEARDLADRLVALEGGFSEVWGLAANAHAMAGDIDRARLYWLKGVELAHEEQLTALVADSLEGLAYGAALRGKTDTALRLHYCAKSLLDEIDGKFATPIEARVAECIQRLEMEVGARPKAILRADGEALTVPEAISMALAAG